MVPRPLAQRTAQGTALTTRRGGAPRFLIVRFSAIGDCVIATWAATAIRNRYPDCFLGWAVETRCAAVVDTETLVDALQPFDRGRWKQNRWSPQTWREQLGAFSRLRQYDFDVGVDLQGHSKTSLCLLLSGAKRRLLARTTDRFAAVLNPVFMGVTGLVHEVEFYRAVLQEFGDFPMPERPIMPSVDPQALGVPSLGSLATIQTGASGPGKKYAPEKWAEVAREMIARGYTVAALGAPGDPRIEAEGVLDWVGKLSLSGAMAAVASSRIHLAGDTSTGHIAAAYGVPVVSIFGPMPSKKFRPYTDRGVVLERDANPNAIEPREVTEAALTLLGAHETAVSN